MKNTIKNCLLACMLAASAATVPGFANETSKQTDVFWKNATVYFMLTDRFANGDPANDGAYGRVADGGKLRNFMGGDIKGITAKIEEGYFDKLGVNVLWMTPLIEQVRGAWEDEYSKTYAYHGYWPRDWTKVDAAFGTEAEMKAMIEAAHKQGIRVLADVIINHTGPVTSLDPRWPSDWVRSGDLCQWHNFQNNVTCRLADSLEDIKTEVTHNVQLPPTLVDQWKKEGRYEKEVAELDAFFERSGYPRAPHFYIIKWLTDWVREYGIDGFRADTAKHIEPEIWQVLKTEATAALKEWKNNNPDKKIDDKEFFMVGEVYNWGLLGFEKATEEGRSFDYSDRKVDFFDHGFDSLINMGFATHAEASYEEIFSRYSDVLNGEDFGTVGVLNYIGSHDDMGPFDQDREYPFEAANRLMLAPGGVQIYYGDEVARPMRVAGTLGDATLRAMLDWQASEKSDKQALLAHWQKLGQFRRAHPAVGAGVHKQRTGEGYVFSRTLVDGDIQDRVFVALDQNNKHKSYDVGDLFSDGDMLKDFYSGKTVTVKDGVVSFNSAASVVLLGKPTGW